MPTSKTIAASAANDVKEKAPPVAASADALLLALALGVAVAVALALAVALAVAEAGISGQTASGSKAVWSFVPNNTLPSGLK
jgi:hypothetical protein